MGKKTVAEFVENDAILDKLHDIGVDFAQGYGIGKPVPIAELASGVARPAHTLKLSEHPCFELCGFGHHFEVPRRLEHKFNVNVSDSRYNFDLCGDILDENVAHSTARCCQCHLDDHVAAAVVGVLNLAIVR